MAPDRTREVRLERKKLVELMKEKKKRNPGGHYFISKGSVMCSDTSQSSEPGLTETGHIPSGSNAFKDVLQRSKTFASRFSSKAMVQKLNFAAALLFCIISRVFYLEF